METLATRIENLGDQIDHVTLEVDYQIIEHFSQHLYDSPNKAVEELVTNGFDACATNVQVFTPGPFVTDRLMVWDNGHSMDVEGLKKLWWIAKSPKSGQRTEAIGDHERKLIGKFGIGKLASYSVGNVISHLCRNGNDFYLVCVDYQKVGVPQQGDELPSERHTAPVVKLAEESANTLIRDLFDTLPERFQCTFDESSWTLAIIEDLKISDLPEGRLNWILGNGMPLRPDFSISVNETLVESKLKKEAVIEWNFGVSEITEAIRSRWTELLASTDGTSQGAVTSAPGTVDFGSEVGLDPSQPDVCTPFVSLPHLGKVWGDIRLFDETLLKYRSADSGRSHGFFLMVRGRLTNPEDDKLYIPDPSFQTFFRSQFVIHADGLDNAILADRQRLRMGNGVAELEALQRALIGVARTTIEARDDERTEAESASSTLPVGSRTYCRGPLNALALRAPIDDVAEFNPSEVTVGRKELGEDADLSLMSFQDGEIQVNCSHPYYRALERRAGGSRVGREFLRSLDLFAVSERLLEGHLLELGFSVEDIGEIIAWRDGLFRQMAKLYDGAPTEIIREMERASYPGGASFELAISNVFQDMGFVSKRAGASGEKDVFVTATVGPDSYSFILEAKGSGGSVGNDDAEVGAAASHRNQANAEHAIIVAREFAGLESRGDQAALFQECLATGGVSPMTTNALARLHDAVTRFSYPLDTIKDILFGLETPDKKLERIGKLEYPQQDFDYRRLLEDVWARQEEEAAGSVVPYRSVHQQGGWRDELEFEDFQRRLIALETLAAGRVQVDPQSHDVHLRQAPSLILEQMERTLQGDGADMRGEGQ